MRYLVLLLLIPTMASAHDASARYIGNAGVLVSDGDNKVVFDAFYANSYGQYLLVAEPTKDALLEDQPPFDGVDAVVVSHVHGDHFTAKPTLDYLRANQDAKFIASTQTVAALEAILGDNDEQIRERLIGFELKPGDQAQSVNVGELTIEAIAIPHSGGDRMADIQNLAFRVSMDDTVVQHFGDAAIDDAVFAAQQSFFDARQTDAAFPPYWFFMDPAGHVILEDRVKAAQNIGVHVPAAAGGEGDKWRAQLKGDLFTDPGEERPLPSSPQ
ncbi:MAG: hypothetical protein DHS20C11_37660 [Lysobacteraceae bacterium]|nr:MAG: hypothetical protein DHS20C11_37660 [Xanthomonadaceae bacterium]